MRIIANTLFSLVVVTIALLVVDSYHWDWMFDPAYPTPDAGFIFFLLTAASTVPLAIIAMWISD